MNETRLNALKKPGIVFGIGIVLLILGHSVFGILGLAIGGYWAWHSWENS